MLIVTDMFDGTPSNLAMTFLGQNEVEIIAGMNPPMLFTLAGLSERASLLEVGGGVGDARARAEHHLGGLGLAPRRGRHESTRDTHERRLARPLVDPALDARWFPGADRTGHAGLRGIRFSLARPAIFKTQLRAHPRGRDGTLRRPRTHAWYG